MDLKDFEGYHVWGYSDASQCTDDVLHCVAPILQHANGGQLYCVSDDEGKDLYVGGEAEILRNTNAEKIQYTHPIIYRAGAMLAVMGECYADRLAKLIVDNSAAQEYVGAFTKIQEGFRVRLMTFMEYKGICFWIGEMADAIFDRELAYDKGMRVSERAERALTLRRKTYCDTTFLFQTWMRCLIARSITNPQDMNALLLSAESCCAIPQALLCSLVKQRIDCLRIS